MTRKKMTAEQEKLPYSVVLNQDQVRPTILEAFKRWQDMGEVPKGARLCQFVGSNDHKRKETHRDIETGELVDPAEWKTICAHLGVKGRKEVYQIFEIPG